MNRSDISQIRSFNRYYTEMLGLLDRNILDSPFSLTEGRILFEISQSDNCTVTKLSEELHLNIGYLSRLLRILQSNGLIKKERAVEDGRINYLLLTGSGKKEVEIINKKADAQIAEIIKNIPEDKRKEIVNCMLRIKDILNDNYTRNNSLSRNDVNIVDGRQYIEEIKGLIIDYAKSLDRDLSFQHFDEEINNLKGKYIPPNGELLAAVTSNNDVIGCVALHRHSNSRCEMKRLYVKPAYRKANIGKRLIENIIFIAKKNGYKEMVLDTIKPLQSAISLYRKIGFVEIPAYYENPMPDVIYMKLELS